MNKFTVFLSSILIFTFLQFSYGQCPGNAELGKNNGCFHLASWTPDPVPNTVYIYDGDPPQPVLYTYEEGTSYHYLGPTPNCNANSSPFTGDIYIGNLVCTYDNGVFSSEQTLAMSQLQVEVIQEQGIPKIVVSNFSIRDNQTYVKIERSVDLMNWLEIGEYYWITGRDDVNFQSWAFSDDNPIIGNNYYRVIQTDENHQISISNVFHFLYKGAEQIVLSPNPSYDHISIKSIVSEAILSVKILGMNGKVLQEYVDGFNHIDLSALDDAMYHVVIETSDHRVYNKRFIKM